MAASDDQSIGRVLRRLRHREGLTLEDLAEHSGVSARALSNVERGVSRAPQRRTLQAIADALGLTADDRHELSVAARRRRRRGDTPELHVSELPSRVRDFVGRARELSVLAGLAHTARQQGSPAQVVVTGPAGMGKTSLAVLAASGLRDGFPGGAHFTDLLGMDPQPAIAPHVQHRVLRQLGVPDADIPQGVADRSELYRARLASEQPLLVFDNAADENQVGALLADSGGAMVVVTSRHRLDGLARVDRLVLDPLAHQESLELLRGILRDRRLDPDDVTDLMTLADLCGHSPLALRIAASRLHTRPNWSPGYLVERLRDSERRLPSLSVGELRFAATIRVSYEQLSTRAAQVFRRATLIPGADAEPELIAVAVGADRQVVQAGLDELHAVSLIGLGPRKRYRFHDLLRLYARSRLAEEEDPEQVRQLRERVVTWLLHTAISAGWWFDPDNAQASAPDDDFGSAREAQRWLDAELGNWYAAVQMAADNGRWQLVVDVAESLHWASDYLQHWSGWVEVYRLATDAAVALADARAEATQLNYRAWAALEIAQRPEDAIALAQRAYAVATEVGDDVQRGWSRQYEARALQASGLFADAAALADEAVAIFAAAGNDNGLSQALVMSASAHDRAGRSAEARTGLVRLRTLLDDPDRRPGGMLGDHTEIAMATGLGSIAASLGEHGEACSHLEHARNLADRFGQPHLRVWQRYRFAAGLRGAGKDVAGLRELRDALVIAEDAGLGTMAELIQKEIDAPK